MFSAIWRGAHAQDHFELQTFSHLKCWENLVLWMGNIKWFFFVFLHQHLSNKFTVKGSLTHLIQCAASQFRCIPSLMCRWSLQILQVLLHMYVYDKAFCHSTALQLFAGISSFHTSITAASSPPALSNTVLPPQYPFTTLPQSSFPTFIFLTYFSSLLSAFSSLSKLLLFNFKTSPHESFPTFLSTIKM